MADCKHTKIQTWADAETSEPVDMWSCADCGRKFEPVEVERDADAERYRWLCANNFDREGPTQVHTWLHTWEPHSQTGEPTEWKQRIRGGALDATIDAAIAATPQSQHQEAK